MKTQSASCVHPQNLDRWTLPDEAKGKDIWKRIYKEINNFEEYLTNNGIHVLKFLLHMSERKTRKDFLKSSKRTKNTFSRNDIEDRELWTNFINTTKKRFPNQHETRSVAHYTGRSSLVRKSGDCRHHR